jgi:hypothetical protein
VSIADLYTVPPPPPPPVPPTPRAPAVVVTAGLGAALAGALVWLGLGMLPTSLVGLAGVGTGIAVAWAMRRMGTPATPMFGIVAAMLAVLGCALGHLLEEYANLADYLNAGFLDTVRHAPFTFMRELWLKDATPVTWVIYGFAAFTAFRGVVARRPRAR